MILFIYCGECIISPKIWKFKFDSLFFIVIIYPLEVASLEWMLFTVFLWKKIFDIAVRRVFSIGMPLWRAFTDSFLLSLQMLCCTLVMKLHYIVVFVNKIVYMKCMCIYVSQVCDSQSVNSCVHRTFLLCIEILMGNKIFSKLINILFSI